jgi:bifunctional UDP-N-acetylglucosamine pyrophosphorylase/glucosamine-1-phosphate N-acetyltransferase
LRGTTHVETGAEVRAHTEAIDARVGSYAAVGPFCYLRPGTVLEARSKAGTFVEIKNSRIGPRAKVPHQSYIGDAEVGEDTNIGAGTITANYPHRTGEPKGRTKIGKNVRTGVHNAFVAPVEVGDGAWTAAGSVITKDVPDDALAVARARQENKEGYAARHRDE